MKFLIKKIANDTISISVDTDNYNFNSCYQFITIKKDDQIEEIVSLLNCSLNSLMDHMDRLNKKLEIQVLPNFSKVKDESNEK